MLLSQVAVASGGFEIQQICVYRSNIFMQSKLQRVLKRNTKKINCTIIAAVTTDC